MAKKLAVRCADAAGHYGEFTSQNNWILFGTAAARDAFMAEFSCSGRVWIDPQQNEVDEIELLPQEGQVVNLKDKVAALEAALEAANAGTKQAPAAASK